MTNIERIENGLKCNGLVVRYKEKKNGKGYILYVDGKRISVSKNRFILLYAFFSSVFMETNYDKLNIDMNKAEDYL